MTRRRSSLAKKRAAEAARSEATAAADTTGATCIDADDGGKVVIAQASGAPVEPSPSATTSSQLSALADVSSTSAQPALCCAAPPTSAADEETSASSGVAAAVEAATLGIPAAFMNRQASQTRANYKTVAMSKQKLHRTSLVEKMTASAIALRKASIASKAFHHTKKQQITPPTTGHAVEVDTPVTGFDLASLLKEADSIMATADAVITAPTTPIRATAAVEDTVSTSSVAIASNAAEQRNTVLLQSSSTSSIAATGSTAIAVAATTAATIDTGVVSDEQRLLEGSRVRLPRSPISAQYTNNGSDSILSDNEDDVPKSMPTLHQSF
eukprot:19516-Heterococcus_DN1.PRE.2